jgi:hypothetical protein
VRGERRKLHNEELVDLSFLPNIIRVIKSKRMRWAGHVARMGRGKVCVGFRWGTLREINHLEDPGVERMTILRRIFRKWDVGDTDWIELAEDRDRWRGLVNAVMNILVL